MNELEATRAKLKCLEMVEGTNLHWRDVLKLKGCHFNTKSEELNYPFPFYEFALGVVEGKPVWEGDEVFCPTAGAFVMQDGKRKLIAVSAMNGGSIMMKDGGIFSIELLSWNPPKPATLMVELPIEDVEYYADERELTLIKIENLIDRRAKACRKALEQLK